MDDGLRSADADCTIESASADRARIYAVVVEWDADAIERADIGASLEGAYSEVQRVLGRHGFNRRQGSVYFGGPQVNAVSCVMAAMDLSRSLPWFAISVRDIRMLRIEEQNALLPAVEQAAPNR